MRYRKYSHDDYFKAMQLFKEDLELTETCRVLGWSETRKQTLYYWKHGKRRSPMTRWNPEPSNELVYIIGVLHGDGYIKIIHHYNYDIELRVKDLKFAEEFSVTEK